MDIKLLDKYLAPSETRARDPWARLCDRVSGLMAYSSEREKIYQDLLQFEWLPNSPCLVNAGRPGGRNMMACHAFVVPNSVKEIFNRVGWAAEVFKSGGGIGLELSKLSRYGTPLSYAPLGIASGPVVFLRAFDTTAQVVMEGGLRRAAMLAALKASHADILAFIACKEEDETLSNFNITVTVDEGPRSVKPDVWNAIIRHAWWNGEPGIGFLDHINEDNPTLEEFGPIEALNACQPGFATVLTPGGIKTLDDVQIGSKIWSGKGWTKIVKKWYTGVKPVYRVLSSKGEFIGTSDHKVFCKGKRVTVENAKSMDWCTGEYCTRDFAFDYQQVVDGIVLGDGCVHKASGDKVFLYIGAKDQDYFTTPVSKYIGTANGIHRPYSYNVSTQLLPCDLPRTYLRSIPPHVLGGDRQAVASFLRGLFTANGYVVSTIGRIGLKQSSAGLIRQAQQMLSSLGISSYVSITKSRVHQFRNGDYRVREAYDLNITVDSDKFMDLIGFEQNYKVDSYRSPVHGQPHRSGLVQSREYLGTFQVYEITVDAESHTYWSGGLLVSNCAELPLYDMGSCVLGSLVLPNVIRQVGDWSDLRWATLNLTEFLNRVIDVNHYPLPEIAQATRRTRDIGIGVMGFATLLEREGIPYTSKDALTLARQIASCVHVAAMEKSWALAERDGGYLPLRPRNARLTAIAPTGHISKLAGVWYSMYPFFADAMKMTVDEHLDMLAVWQKYVDSSISYTVNLPSDATEKDVDAAYRGAYDRGIKVLSVYRDGSRANQPCTLEGVCGT